jgi:hypothetical protein
VLWQPHRKSPGQVHLQPIRHRIPLPVQAHYFSQPYSLDQLEFFAAYVIPQNTWYLIPAPVVLRGEVTKKALMLFPMEPEKRGRYLYEHYREAWPLLRPQHKKKSKPRRKK